MLLWQTWLGLERQITWYLAVDQFGYLNFAHDLLQGRVFHQWEPLKALQQFLPPRTDILVQTYVNEGGKLYCRYSPGFPILLAGWIGLFGDDAAHVLNSCIFLALLLVVTRFHWRASHSPWRGGASAAMIALFPTMIHLWGLTLTRDLSAHVAAFTGLLLLNPAGGTPLAGWRTLAGGLALGFAVTIRPDAAIYVIPASAMMGVRWWREGRRIPMLARSAAVGALGIAIGLAPFLAYNAAAVGNPFLPTQGMELPLLPSLPPPPAKPKRPVLPKKPADKAPDAAATSAPAQAANQAADAPAAPATTGPAADAPPAGEQTPKVGYPSRGWRGGTFDQVQGGGLRISNLETTLPGNWNILLRAYTGPILLLALFGAATALILRPAFAVAAIIYCVVGFVFFSCWPRPDHRYLVGVFIFLPMLIVEGVCGGLDLLRLLQRRGRADLAHALAGVGALLLALGAAVSWSSAAELQPPLQALATTIQVLGALGLAAAFALPGRRLVQVLAMVLMLALVGLKVQRVQAEEGRRAPFQKPQMQRARANMERLLEKNAVVITSEAVGRPAENIEWYGGRGWALYLTDLERWRLTPDKIAGHLILNGFRPYLFLRPNEPDKDEMIEELRKVASVDKVADLTPDQAMSHFVAAPFHRGVRMELWRVSMPEFEQRMREHGMAPPPGR
ncbi:MAG: hypothetical protein KIT14_09130 [bacterium]|nr:hypothetical protein [bacterium]